MLRKMTFANAIQVAIYGLPSAGVLALELLQQSQGRGAYTIKNFPRSEVIQNLSVFVATLHTVHAEGDGNYQLCLQARRMLQRILDTVLSPEQPVPALSNRRTLLTRSTIDFSEENAYDMSWMDNAAFDADFWLNLPDHPLLATTEPNGQSGFINQM
jgi:hypothetical protein